MRKGTTSSCSTVFNLILAMLSALHSALAPEVPMVVDFRYHWDMFLKYYAKQVSGAGKLPH